MCSSYFLSNGFCCRAICVDSEPPTVALVSSHGILTPLASLPPCHGPGCFCWCHPALRQLQLKVQMCLDGGWGEGPPGRRSLFSQKPLLCSPHEAASNPAPSLMSHVKWMSKRSFKRDLTSGSVFVCFCLGSRTVSFTKYREYLCVGDDFPTAQRRG